MTSSCLVARLEIFVSGDEGDLHRQRIMWFHLAAHLLSPWKAGFQELDEVPDPGEADDGRVRIYVKANHESRVTPPNVHPHS